MIKFKPTKTFAACAPYFVWMVLMFLLPQTAEMYALRTVMTLCVLVWALCRHGIIVRPFGFSCLRDGFKNLGLGVFVGLVVCVLWVLPEKWEVYRNFSLMGFLGMGGTMASAGSSAYEPSVCGWSFTIIKLSGSAFVIAPVEEIFFRSFLYRWLQKVDWVNVDLRVFDLTAFCWMVSLFALEHHTRLLAGAMAGAFYGWLAIRRGIGAAIIAHVVTNLFLGFYVFYTGEWGFW